MYNYSPYICSNPTIYPTKLVYIKKRNTELYAYKQNSCFHGDHSKKTLLSW